MSSVGAISLRGPTATRLACQTLLPMFVKSPALKTQLIELTTNWNSEIQSAAWNALAWVAPEEFDQRNHSAGISTLA